MNYNSLKLTIALLIGSFCACGQIHNETIINEVSVIEKGLLPFINTAVLFERKCDYYSDSLLFTIDVRIIGSKYEIQIESVRNPNTVFNDFEPIFGYLYVKNHLVFVYGQPSVKFFQIGEDCKQFKFFKKNEASLKTDSLYLNDIIDDSNSIWNYLYVEDEFILVGKSSSCN